MRFNSLAFRISITAAVWTALVLPIAGAVVYWLYSSDVLEEHVRRLRTSLFVMLADNSQLPDTTPVPPTSLGEELFEFPRSGWYWQITPVGGATGIALTSTSLENQRIHVGTEQKPSSDPDGVTTRFDRDPFASDRQLRIFEARYQLGPNPDGPTYAFIVAAPADWINPRINRFGVILAGALAVAGLLLIAMTYFQIRFGLRPLRDVERGLQAIRTGKTERLEGDLPSEISSLQHELNALISSNQEIIDRARTQVGNLAHALKTPLAVIVNEAGEVKGVFADKIAEQARIMRDQITHYLDRARIAARVATIGRVAEVEPVVNGLARTLTRIYRDKNVELDIDIEGQARFQGERHDLEEMLGNLLDNAFKWARSRVSLSVLSKTANVDGGSPMLRIEVDDDGPGLRDEQREQIGKRGLRLDESKPGSGLGLSIVSDLARSYRGGFRLEASERGGLKVVLELPAAPRGED